MKYSILAIFIQQIIANHENLYAQNWLLSCDLVTLPPIRSYSQLPELSPITLLYFAIKYAVTMFWFSLWIKDSLQELKLDVTVVLQFVCHLSQLKWKVHKNELSCCLDISTDEYLESEEFMDD